MSKKSAQRLLESLDNLAKAKSARDEEIERLQAENERLQRLVVRDKHGKIITQVAFNAMIAQIISLREHNEILQDELRDVSRGWMH